MPSTRIPNCRHCHHRITREVEVEWTLNGIHTTFHGTSTVFCSQYCAGLAWYRHKNPRMEEGQTPDDYYRSFLQNYNFNYTEKPRRKRIKREEEYCAVSMKTWRRDGGLYM